LNGLTRQGCDNPGRKKPTRANESGFRSGDRGKNPQGVRTRGLKGAKAIQGSNKSKQAYSNERVGRCVGVEQPAPSKQARPTPRAKEKQRHLPPTKQTSLRGFLSGKVPRERTSYSKNRLVPTLQGGCGVGAEALIGQPPSRRAPTNVK